MEQISRVSLFWRINIVSFLDVTDLYIQDADKYGHLYGPYSRQVKDAVQQIDEDIYMLLDELQQQDIEDEVNVLVFSDHGMTDIHAQQKINISKALDMNDIKAISEALTQVYIWPHAGLEEKVSLMCFLFIFIEHKCGVDPPPPWILNIGLISSCMTASSRNVIWQSVWVYPHLIQISLFKMQISAFQIEISAFKCRYL